MEVARCGRKVFLSAAPPLSWASKGGLNEGLKGDAKAVGILFLFPDPAVALFFSCYYHRGKRKHTILTIIGQRTAGYSLLILVRRLFQPRSESHYPVVFS